VLAAILAAFWLVRWPFRETVLIRDGANTPGHDVAVLRPGQAEFVLWRLRDAAR
jgi:hypothetical protein